MMKKYWRKRFFVDEGIDSGPIIVKKESKLQIKRIEN